MDRGTATRIEEQWDRREAGAGRDGLAKLGDTEFSGAVEAGGVWLFVLNGRIVGSSGGSEDTLGPKDPLTAYLAPHPSLPLLFAMQDRGGETRGRYFTDDTPLAEVHETLSSGRFTGYVELSENVHSGDYYVVYYGGRALYAAFIGNAERLLTGEEAFERATDEVGIYEVTSVDLDVRDAPRTDERETGGAAGAAGGKGDPPDTGHADPTEADDRDGSTAGASDAAGPEGATSTDPTGAGYSEVGGSNPAESRDGGSNDAGATAAAGSADSGDGGEGPPVADRRESDPEAGGDPDPDRVSSPDEDADTPETGTGARPDVETESPTVPDPGLGPGVDEGEGPDDGADREEPGAASGEVAESFAVDAVDSVGEETTPPRTGEDAGEASDPDRAVAGTGAAGDADGTRFDEEADWRDQQTVPALDPERSDPPEEESAEVGAGVEDPTPSAGGDPAERAPEQSGDASAPDRLEELESEIESLQGRVDALSAERDDLRAERDRLAEERDRLQEQVRTLQASDGATGGGEDLSAGAALGQTDLLVRYGSKSEDTLADAHDGDATRESVGANLRLNTHTRFEADGVTVEGEAFESFIRGALAYRFVRWLTEDLLFEIRETDNRTRLRDLYDALPEIDRAEFDGTVTIEEASGEEHASSFDVVVRDQVGEPLLVADVDGGRDPTEGGMMEGLLDRATDVAESTGSLSAAFLVTASFFHNEVHTQAREATKKGFLDRDSRASFVKAARNDGYHVCLIEAHDGEFHVSRPDL